MDIHPLEVLRRPIITEKFAAAQDLGKYAFEVHPSANKKQIKEAVELAFKVKVRAVNVMSVQGKTKRVGARFYRTSDWKKAVVTLQAGNRIEVFEGI
jgi:large subunit ribosomal protein L23